MLQSRGRTEVLRQGRSRTDQRTVSQVSAAVSRTHFDKDGRGLINGQYLKSVLQSYGEPLENEDLNELMKMADIKGDGKIDYLGTVYATDLYIYIIDVVSAVSVCLSTINLRKN